MLEQNGNAFAAYDLINNAEEKRKQSLGKMEKYKQISLP
jgi:hypothetical protein